MLDVNPAERAQRVSTLASAAASIQTAASVTAALPAAGVGIRSARAKLNNEIGKLEALQRVPLVVGYLEASQGDEKTCVAPRFGWILGPAFVLDSAGQRLQPSQLLKPYDLQVDLSVPAWWRSLKLSVATAWAGKLGEPIKCDTCWKKPLKIELPTSDSDMDALTRFLFDRLAVHGLGATDRPRILDVSPTMVDSRARNTTLIVRGPGLWRAENVYVYGARQSDVSVLTDMSGLAVTLDPSTLALPPLPGGVDPLAVFTPAGKATYFALDLLQAQHALPNVLPIMSVFPYHIDGETLEIRPAKGRFPPGTAPRIAYSAERRRPRLRTHGSSGFNQR